MYVIFPFLNTKLFFFFFLFWGIFAKVNMSREKKLARNYFAFKYFNLERAWWKLFQKRVVRTKFDFYCYHWFDTSAGGQLVPGDLSSSQFFCPDTIH